jgi:hypothetical protein
VLKKGDTNVAKLEEKKDEHSAMLDDTNIVAYLHLCGFRFNPVNKGGGRIGFRVYGDIDQALSNFYNNEKIGIQDYVGCLKKVRGSMFLLKGMDEGETKTHKTKED